MNLSQLHEQLKTRIRKEATRSLDARQVARRLKDLLPSQLMQLRQKHRDEGTTAASAERRALTDPEYIRHLNELINLRSDAHAARIQYETHLMLFQARQSLRSLRKR